MAKNLGAQVIDLLTHERVELRAAAATVLAAVGGGDKGVEAALMDRLTDPDVGVRRLALEGLAGMDAAGSAGIAAKMVLLLQDDDDQLAARAAQLLAAAGASAESALRKAIGAGPIPARRVVAQLLLRRGTSAAIEPLIDQLASPDFGEQALQLLRAEIDTGAEKLIALVEKSAASRIGEASSTLQKAWNRATKAAANGATSAPAKGKGKPVPGQPVAAIPAPEPLHDPEVAASIGEVGALLRLIGYMARPSTQSLLLAHVQDGKPRPIRLAAIAGLRRIVAASESRGTETVIATLIELADGDELAVAHAAVDTLRGARIPEKLARQFAGLAKSKNSAAQKLAMERMPAGGGASAVKALIEALGAEEATARDAAGRGLARAPEAVLPITRALIAATDEQVARRYATALRAHRGNISTAAIKELVDAVRGHMQLHARGKATADTMVLERAIAEVVADVAPTAHVELLFDRARGLRKAGKSIEAFGSLKPLLRSRADLDAAISDDDRFFLAMLALEAAGEGILRGVHADDPVFGQFSRLAAKGYPVASKLAKEKDISDEAIYALGFRLLESKDASNEELGSELLQSIIDERPRSKLARSAKNKLKLAGYGGD